MAEKFFKTIKEIPKEEILGPGTRACQGCMNSLAVRLVMKGVGSNSVVISPTGCLEITTSCYPYTAWAVPWYHVAFENAGAVASGVEAAFKILMRKGRLKREKIHVVAIAGDGGTADIGLQAWSGALERGHDLLYVCLDNEAYMNCLSTSSVIMTESGPKKITDVKKGSKIYAFDQKTHTLVLKRCTGVFDNGEREIFVVETSNHSIKATPNHPFLVLERCCAGGLVWKTLGELKLGDRVVVLRDMNDQEPSQSCKPLGDEWTQRLGRGNTRNEYFEVEKIKRIEAEGRERVLDLRVEGEHNFVADGIVVHNTGIQRSSLTPRYAWTTTSEVGMVIPGKVQPKKDLVAIAQAHKIPYVATACTSYPLDLINKAKKGAEVEGPAYLHIFVPCPVGWRFPSNLSIKIGRLGVQTGVFPIFEVENGKLRLTIKVPKRKPVREYLKLQGRFAHLTEKMIEEIQQYVDAECEKLGLGPRA